MKRSVSLILVAALFISLCFGFSITARAEAMAFSSAAIDILKKIEGFSARPYWDVSQYTVGYGTRCPDDLLEEFENDPKKVLSEEAALLLLDQQLASFVSAVNSFAGNHSLTLTQNQFDALVLFSYNCGTSWTTETTGYFYNAVKSQVTGTDFIYAICLWSSAGGEYILTKRRLSEANMYLNNVYEAYNDSADGTYPNTYKYVFMDGNGGTVNYTMHGYDAADKSNILTQVTPPTGIDKNGKTFTYTLDGWYTAGTGGTKIEKLDGSLSDGTILYAHWKDPEGNVVDIPRGNPCTIKATTTYELSVTTGPGTAYPETTSKIPASQTFTLTELYKDGELYWGKCQQGWISLGTNWPLPGSVTATDVNVRNGPGTSNAKQYQLSMGDSVSIHELTYSGSLMWGRLSDGNWICMDYVHILLTIPGQISGDINTDGAIDKDDAILLLRHVVFPDDYPISVNGDINKDGAINKDDAIYLLRHVVFPDDYPLPS